MNDNTQRFDALLNRLQQGVSALQLPLPDSTLETMVRYLFLLEKWNKAFNLTAITDLNQMLTHHLLDSLSVLPYVPNGHVIDIGTGAGFPGFVLALCLPEQTFTLLDSNGKKTRFLTQAKMELNVPNIEVAHARSEDYQTSQCFDGIIFRAVGAIPDLMQRSSHLICANGLFLFMKGTLPLDELSAINGQYDSHKLNVPGLSAERHLVVVQHGVSKT